MLTPKKTLAVMAIFAAIAAAKELPVNLELKAELYDSGIRHEQIMALKNVSFCPYQ